MYMAALAQQQHCLKEEIKKKYRPMLICICMLKNCPCLVLLSDEIDVSTEEQEKSMYGVSLRT